jgi:glutaryl-CoA dehydrogenase (non-decarboxylating)
MCGLSLLRWGSEAQKSRFLMPQADGSRVGTAAIDVSDEETVGYSTPFIARKVHSQDGISYVLDGNMSGVRLAMVADHFLVVARSVSTEQMTAFIVERGQAGVVVDDAPAGDAIPLFGDFTLNGVHMPESHRLGAEGEGEAIGRFAVNAGRFAITAGAIGIVKRCINHSLACIDQQKDRNDNYARFSPMVAGMFRRVEMARRMLNEAIQTDRLDAEMSRSLSLAHWFATTAAQDSMADATQIESVCARYAAPAYGDAI